MVEKAVFLIGLMSHVPGYLALHAVIHASEAP